MGHRAQSRWKKGVVGLLPLMVMALVLVGLPGRAHACLWDRDTLAMEIGGVESVVDAAVGRFPRNPPRYYEMRLERVLAELDDGATDPLALLDDAEVACDRLGDHERALAFMAQKRALLETGPDAYSAEQLAEHEYRYLANLGTFYAHQAIAAAGVTPTARASGIRPAWPAARAAV